MLLNKQLAVVAYFLTRATLCHCATLCHVI